MSDNALGRGLDALIQKPKDKTKESTTENEEKQLTSIKETEIKKEEVVKADDKLEKIKKEVEKNPRISLWSLKSAACLKYLKKTIPEFSISNEASLLLDEAISSKYPEIWELFDDL